MSDKTPLSLRTQIIDAMNTHAAAQGWAERTPDFNADMFDQAIMPVLQRAMDAGALLVGRNTKDRIPVHVAVREWMRKVQLHVDYIRSHEAVISKRQALKVIYQFGDECGKALYEDSRNQQELH